MTMIRKEVKRVEIVYADGTVEAYDTDHDAYHVVRQNYSKGAKTPADGWQQHEIRWTDPETMHPKVEEEDETPSG